MSTTTASPTYSKLLDGQQYVNKNNVRPSVNTTNRTMLHGHGTLHQDIKPTKFIPNQKKKLFILGYQRVGSSFLGQLFDENPNFFYIYEPLDAVYAEMFGTAGGLNVPSDITHYSNGTMRQITVEENTKVLQLLTNILECNVDKLPQGFFLHRFWDYLVEAYMPSWKRYRACLEDNGVLHAREECRTKHLGRLCPERFGLNVSDQKYCKTKIAELAKYGRHNGPKIQPFIKYEDCVQLAFRRGGRCVEIYREKCAKARLRITKTVRGTMEQAERLLSANPNMRLIHLIRDPRPVVTSRSHTSSYRGVFSGIARQQGGDKAKEAIVYCGTVARDISRRLALEKRFPGRVAQVIYEDFIQNATAYTKALYAFVDEPLPPALMSWVKSQTEGKQWKDNAMVRMHDWKRHMTYREGDKVRDNCGDFYSLVRYPWPY